MRKRQMALIALSALFYNAALVTANAHDWYPSECCDDKDCAPVDSVTRLNVPGRAAPQLVVTSKHGRAIVPQNIVPRQSKDGRMHVCMRRDILFMDVMCLFVPAET